MVYGKGWSEKQLRHCLYFAEIFPDEIIVFRDPYILNFLGFRDTYSKKDLEVVIQMVRGQIKIASIIFFGVFTGVGSFNASLCFFL